MVYNMDSVKFHKIADELLQNLADEIESYNDKIDVDYLQGVLTVTLQNNKQYVINKHDPTKQIWLSSPISGAAKFSYDDNAKNWVGYDNEDLVKLLKNEIKF
jgi:frataxin